MKRQTKISEEKRKKGKISRREFIKDAGLIGAAFGSTMLMAGAAAKPAEAQGTVSVTFELMDPSGAFEVTNVHAPRVTTLEGKTICELSNDSWQALRTFPYLRELIKKQYPTATIIPWTEFPTVIDTAEVAALLKKRGCDVAIVGNGA